MCVSGTELAYFAAVDGVASAQMPLHCIDCRAKIREAILSGRTDEAIRQIGFIDPNVCYSDLHSPILGILFLRRLIVPS